MTYPTSLLRTFLFAFYITLTACGGGNGGVGSRDTTAPVITLTGDASFSLVQNEVAYTEQGASAIDDIDGIVAVTIAGDSVDITTLGTYNVTYTATPRITPPP